MSTAWIAVVASLGGVALGGALELLRETLRSGREDRNKAVETSLAIEERWRQACVNVASLADEVWSRSWSVADHRLANPLSWRTDPYIQAQHDALELALNRFSSAYNELCILGTLSFGDQAYALYEAVSDASRGAFANTPAKPSQGFNTVSNEFINAVCEEFKVHRPAR